MCRVDTQEPAITLNESLAAKLGVDVGDEVVLRIEKPSLMPRDVPLTPDSDLTLAFRLTVKAITSQSDFGNFSLKANQVIPLNAFVPLSWLQQQLERDNQANMLLLAANEVETLTTEKANEAVKIYWPGECWTWAPNTSQR